MKGFSVTLVSDCKEAYVSFSRRLRAMCVHHQRARAAGQEPAWMMSVLAELEGIGGERNSSLVKKTPAQHIEQDVAQRVEPIETPARADSAAASTE